MTGWFVKQFLFAFVFFVTCTNEIWMSWWGQSRKQHGRLYNICPPEQAKLQCHADILQLNTYQEKIKKSLIDPKKSSQVKNKCVTWGLDKRSIRSVKQSNWILNNEDMHRKKCWWDPYKETNCVKKCEIQLPPPPFSNTQEENKSSRVLPTQCTINVPTL